MNKDQEIEMLKHNLNLFHNSFANLLNAYSIISEAYFRLATENYQEPKLRFIEPNMPKIEDLDKEYEAMEKNVMKDKPIKELKIKKQDMSYLG